jgi:NADH dehydrogenase/NADH:ubiquinone oxidoreductase subunit G
MRILPRNNDAVNEEWISDKTRDSSADGLQEHSGSIRPYVRRNGRKLAAGNLGRSPFGRRGEEAHRHCAGSKDRRHRRRSLAAR